ncbi:SCO family protein [Permianibacter sp. IMCC34836]|uniref:SCO family protein n=1 Tax=Permianibacter fluminis TaxID=2738515 RepID=UPI0015564C05|nr:SCO family protein [Permianibacter fluminis]NQD36233.1 SCO family protein [Permianibacter fluminis]
MKRWLLTLLPLLLIGQSIFAAENPALKSGVFDPPRRAPDFALPGSNGREIKLSQFRGKLIALGFGFTHCPNVCPVTLANLTQVRKNLGKLAADVQVLYVTVDPERDTASRMQQYLAGFDASFLGVTGSAEQLAAVRQAYGVAASKAQAAADPNDYTVHHSSYIYLIDRDGRLRALVPFGKSVDDIVHDVKILLGNQR